MVFKPIISVSIALRLITHIVADPVNFDCKASLRTIEIKNIWTNRMLAAKHRLAW